MEQGDKSLDPSHLDTNGFEVTVSWAAWRLQVSDRTITNYLKERKLAGTKVGKSWFIDRASVEAHCARYRVPEPVTPFTSQHPELSAQVPALPPTPPPVATPSPVVSIATTTVQETLGEASSSYSSEPQESITKLKVYVTFKEAMKLTESVLSADPNDPCRRRLRELQISFVESLGAGFYSNWGEKTNHYLAAKAQLGAIISLIYSCSHLSRDLSPFLHKVEQDIIPMLGALIGKLFKTRAKFRKSRYQDDDADNERRGGRRRWSE